MRKKLQIHIKKHIFFKIFNILNVKRRNNGIIV